MKIQNEYAKAIVAVVGSTITAALAIFPAGTTTWNALTIVAAAATAIGVYFVPNTKPTTEETK